MPAHIATRARASFLQRVRWFIQLGRPLHLVGGGLFHGLGIAAAVHLGVAFDLGAALLCQFFISSTQLMTHYSNDYFDQDADAVTRTPTRWASGSRVLPDALLSPGAALGGALVFGGLALLTTGLLVARQHNPGQTLLLAVLEITLAWSYSSPPLSLNRRGWGEVSGALLIPGLTSLLGFQVQSGRLDWLPVLAAVPLCFFQFAMLLSVNFPDAEGDALVGKRTLVVIHGPRRAGLLFSAALLFAYLCLPLLVMQGLPVPAAVAVLATLPLAVGQLKSIHRGAATNPVRWESLAFWSIGLLMLATLAEIIALSTL